MTSPRPTATAVALYVVAALLLLNLLALFLRTEPAAQAQVPAPAMAGGNHVYIMPGQIGANTWGCYLLDTENGTICAYQYLPGRKELEFIAARDFRHDRRMKGYGTAPLPDVVRQWVEKEKGVKDAPKSGGEAEE